MWTYSSQRVEGGRTVKYRIEDGRVLSYGEVIELWTADSSFRSYFADILRRRLSMAIAGKRRR